MKKVALYNPRNTTPLVYDFSTEEKRRQAFLDLFEKYDAKGIFLYEKEVENLRQDIARLEDVTETEDGRVLVQDKRRPDYVEAMDRERWERKIQGKKNRIEQIQETLIPLYEDAKTGDPEAAKRLVKRGREHEAGWYEVVEVENP